MGIVSQDTQLIKQVIKTPEAKPAPAKSAPVASKPVATAPTTTKAPVKVSDYTLSEVITMQDMITSLSNTMVRSADSISASKNISKDDVKLD